MKNENKKYNAVIRVRSNETGIVKERGFVSVAEAYDEGMFLADIVDKVDIFFRLDWFAGDEMSIDGEYWFGKRKKKEAE